MPAFADTNVVVYAFASDDAKIAVAEDILEKQPTISTQVISEFLSVCRIKLGMETFLQAADKDINPAAHAVLKNDEGST